ncbi:MAG: cytochrome c-type biogenesis protein CcmH [Anaerolineae bacterium]|nr:cytochrome c-type biogenesis protein CcmH [Anaerolineae bacterium]
MRKRLIILGLMALLLAGGSLALAQGGEGETAPVREVTADEVNALSSKLYCPVCENIPLDVCGTEACARWREQVRTLLEEGKSEEEVVDYFVTQFGERVVATPRDPLLNFLSWVVPAASVVIGLGIVGIVLVTWRGRTETLAGGDPDDERLPNEDDDYRNRLERELRDLE